MARSSFTEDELDQILLMFNNGVPATQIAKRYDTNPVRVAGLVTERGILANLTPRLRSSIQEEYIKTGCPIKASTKAKADLATAMYVLTKTRLQRGEVLAATNIKTILSNLYVDEDMSMACISKVLHTSQARLSEMMAEAGIEYKTSRGHVINHHFFSDLSSEESSYWLGFMYADGNVAKDRDRFSIRISAVDREHLEMFARHLEWSGKVAEYTYETNFGTDNCVILNATSAQIKRDLISYGCVPNKTKFGVTPNLPSNASARDIMRGLVDGNGTVGNRSKNPRIRLFCNSKHLADWASDIAPAKTYVYQSSTSIWTADWSLAAGLEMAHWLYDDATVFLPRKRAKIEDWIDKP